ncbi:MAG: glycosyltransferase family 2 protein [Bacteroidia bacterium]
MKVSGFTIVRNAVKFDYPIVESITSILSLCDEFIVSVGDCDDGTLELIQGINSSKIRIMHSVWDDKLREGGQVLALETSKAFDAVAMDSDWAFYLQGDEVIHEKYLEAIKEGMERYKNDREVEGLLFDYAHFYGNYNYLGNSRKWYRREIRVIRNNKEIRSYKDAQGFRIHNRKLNVKKIEAVVYHYGWVKPPKAQQAKQQSFHKMWHDDEWMKKNIGEAEEFDYTKIDSLEEFTGSHPAVMAERVKRCNWNFNFDAGKIRLSLKDKLLLSIEHSTGWKPGEYRNYKLI